MGKYFIRQAEESDEAALLALSRIVINRNFRSFMGDEAIDGFLNSGMADAEITDALEETAVLEHNDAVIGLCIWKENLLHLIMVAPDYQGTDAAAYFIHAMCEDKLRVYHEIHLECFESNERAIGFYKKCGWELYKSEMDESVGLKRLFYRKERHS